MPWERSEAGGASANERKDKRRSDDRRLAPFPRLATDINIFQLYRPIPIINRIHLGSSHMHYNITVF